MLKQLDRKEFEIAMFKEVKEVFDNEIWINVPKSEMKQHHNQLQKVRKDPKREQLMLIWIFKRKIHPDSTLNKHKDRICCHVGQQECGINCWYNYSRFIYWVSVRTMLILSAVYTL